MVRLSIYTSKFLNSLQTDKFYALLAFFVEKFFGAQYQYLRLAIAIGNGSRFRVDLITNKHYAPECEEFRQQFQERCPRESMLSLE